MGDPLAKYRPEVVDMEHGRSVVYDGWLKGKDTVEKGNNNTDTTDTDTVDTDIANKSTADPTTVATNTAGMVTADPDTTENSGSVPDGMTLESFGFSYKPGNEGTLVGIADHSLGLAIPEKWM